MQISANYLSAYALNALGCSTSGFDQMRLALQQQIPVMNVNGYRLRTAPGIRRANQPGKRPAERLSPYGICADF